jgi:5'-nucleotidase
VIRALITNDDGYDSAGIAALARTASRCGLQPVVAAPSWDSSGASASLTAVEEEGRLPVRRTERPELPGIPVFAVDAAPAFIVRAAMQGAFGDPPDVVLSGINLGANTGHAVVHSGTVGAALTAANDGRPAMAVSLVLDDELHWATAEHVAGEALAWLVARGTTEAVVLNVNVPSIPLDELRGLRRAHLAPFGAVQTNVTEVGQGYVRVEFAEIDADPEPGTDVAVLRAGYASVTPLAGVCEHTGVLTDDWASALASAGGESE